MSHPAFAQICSALTKESYTSGICEIDTEQCGLYYRNRSTDNESLSYLNLAAATDDEISQLISSSDAAPFGRGTETVLDDTYRKAHKLDVSQFSTVFELAGTPILNKISQDLVDFTVSVKRAVRAERYKLNVYGHSSCRKHVRLSCHCLPYTPRRRTLMLRDEGLEWSFDAAQLLASVTPEAPKVAYVAFYSDLEHEVMPVVSGSRVTLTYNLYFEDMDAVVAPVFTSQGKDHAIKDGLQQLLADTTFLPKGGRLGFTLSHTYPLKYGSPAGHTVSELLPYLKGTDALIYSACQELGLEADLKVHYTLDSEATYLCWEPLDDAYCGEYSDEEAFVNDKDYVIDSDNDLEEGDEEGRFKLNKYGYKVANARVVWVTEWETNNAVKTTYVAYGNEHSVCLIYGVVCLVVDFRRSPKKKAVKREAGVHSGGEEVDSGEEEVESGEEEVDSGEEEVALEGEEVKTNDEQ
ncbi:hypothetical protein BDZ89DRAFT_1121952 [Hymenopellis radicata]|nr:hypothetical protein BDZ89DRAFT_1121952 [Hymenopellis radicata]